MQTGTAVKQQAQSETVRGGVVGGEKAWEVGVTGWMKERWTEGKKEATEMSKM